MNFSVSNYIHDKYSLDIQHGKKGTCPFCGKLTFSIKGDGSIGKCFHPICGKYINKNIINKNSDYISRAVDEIYCIYHNDLLKQKKEKDTHNAYNYLLNHREIHPSVIELSMIGSIPEENFEKDIFDELFNEINQKLKKSSNDDETNHLKNQELKLYSMEEEFYSFIDKKINHLVFFYTDHSNNITRIKVREPYTKNITSFKFIDSPFGIFNHQLFSNDPLPKEYKHHYNRLNIDDFIIFEGEFNQLQFQSILAFNKHPFINSCAIGGASSPDFKTIQKVSNKWLICYDNDEAGKNVVDNAKQYNSFKAFTTPKVNSDIDKYILSFGDDSSKALNEIFTLMKEAKSFYRPPNALKEEINSIRRNKDKLKTFEINQNISNIIIEYLNEAGAFYKNEEPYYFYNSNKSLFNINNNSKELKIILGDMGINSSEQIYKYVIEDLINYSLTHGKPSNIHLFSFYDKLNNILYIHNGDNIFKITTDTITEVNNGADNILFLRDEIYEPFKLITIDQQFNYLSKYVFKYINFQKDSIQSGQYSLMLKYYVYSLFFESILPTKPILTFIGEKGSTKTSTLRQIGTMLKGSKFNVNPLPDKVEDFDTIVTNNHFIVFDNADKKTSWLNDKLACCATGQTIKKRVLYTTNQEINIPVKCFLALTSRTPHFTRDDVADRLLIFKFKRLDNFINEDTIINRILENRDCIMSYIIYQLQIVLNALEKNKNEQYPSQTRMADFTNFAYKIINYRCKPIYAYKIFEKFNNEQNEFTLEGDPIVDALIIWLKENDGKAKGTSREVLNILSKIALKHDINNFHYDHPRNISSHLENIKSNIQNMITYDVREGNSGKKIYYFNLVEE